jgi:hypothetical protein
MMSMKTVVCRGYSVADAANPSGEDNIRIGFLGSANYDACCLGPLVGEAAKRLGQRPRDGLGADNAHFGFFEVHEWRKNDFGHRDYSALSNPPWETMAWGITGDAGNHTIRQNGCSIV